MSTIGTLTLEFDGEIVHFNIFEAMRYPSDLNAYFAIDTLDTLAQKILDLDCEDTLEVVMRNSLEHDKTMESILVRSYWKWWQPLKPHLFHQ